ncbi:hypothetical protein R6Q59_033118 [Mikania micrantha]
MKSKSVYSASGRYEDNIFASMIVSPAKQNDHFDDLIGNLGGTEKVDPPKRKAARSARGLDDLLPDFGNDGSHFDSSRRGKKKVATTVSNDFSNIAGRHYDAGCTIPVCDRSIGLDQSSIPKIVRCSSEGMFTTL